MVEYLHRFYRQWMRPGGLVPFRVVAGESDLYVWARKDLSREALRSLLAHRRELEDFIRRQPFFRESYLPYRVPASSPEIVRRMAAAAERVGVGPMAAVAGAVAELVGEDLAPLSPELVVENGGDIYLRSRRPRRVGVFAGESRLSGRLAVVVPPSPDRGMGVCTSSATVGPSYSAGVVDAALVVAESAALADAAATALGNLVKKPGDIQPALEHVAAVEGVMGCLVILGDRLGVKGDLELEEVPPPAPEKKR